MANETFHQLIEKAHKLSLKLTKEKLILNKMDPENLVYQAQLELIQGIRSELRETKDRIKEIELEIFN